MILIADSGSTKTAWCLVEDGRIKQQIKTKGINPFFQSEEEIQEEIGKGLIPYLPTHRMGEVHFYGAGCAFPDKLAIIHRVITSHFEVSREVEVNTDMLAAARSLCGHLPGIACILGTGSNSCHYDGRDIVENVSPLGFILGDEGSGAVLGRVLVGNILKNQLPTEMKNEFLNQYGLSASEIIDKVYRHPFPNRFLASLSPFLAQHIDVPEIRRLVLESFKDFLKRNVMQYDYNQYPVHFTGSVAFYYKDILRQATQEMEIELGNISQSPMEGLVKYHQTVRNN